MLREKWHLGWDLWLFVVNMAHTFLFYDDDDDDGDAHHFLHNLWLIWLEIRSAFSASFQSRFSSTLRASVCQGFLHTKTNDKYLICILTFESGLYIDAWKEQRNHLLAFAYISNIYILMLQQQQQQQHQRMKTYILQRDSVFNKHIGNRVSAPQKNDVNIQRRFH